MFYECIRGGTEEVISMELSIIIPIYNAEKYVLECLESIKINNKDSIEVLLIDDGSTDQSADICKRWCETHLNYHYHRKKNGGVSSARNKGIEIACGKYIMFLDADDKLAQDWQKKVILFLEKDYDFIAFSYSTLFSDGTVKKELFSKNQASVIKDKEQIMEILLTTPLLHTCWAKLFKKQIIQSGNIFFPKDVSIGEDYIFVLEYMQKSFKGLLVNDVLLYYRQVSDSAMRRFQYSARKDALIQLFLYVKEYAIHHQCQSMIDKLYVYYFRSFTKFMLDMSAGGTMKQCIRWTNDILSEKNIQMILSNVKKECIGSIKKLEWVFLKRKMVIPIVCYFKIKSIFMKR